jgi:putative ABC transport system ATP-binding protein
VAASGKSVQLVVPKALTATTNGHVATPSDSVAEPIIHVEHLTKNYVLAGGVVHALRDVSVDVFRGEFVAIMGASGSGKSTFMNLIGCLDRPTSGTYQLDGIDVAKLDSDGLALVRNRKVGFIFQGFNLLPRMTAISNVMLPMAYAGLTPELMRRRGEAALAAVGLADRADHRPSQMSGGQQQRAAIARSLVNGPSMILADEPTGNLDSRTSVEVMAILQQLNERGITIVLVTHEPDIATYCKRVIRFRDGRVIEDAINRDLQSAAQVLRELPDEDPEEGP